MHSLANKAIGSARGGSSLRHIKKVNSNVILTLLTVSFEIKKNQIKSVPLISLYFAVATTRANIVLSF